MDRHDKVLLIRFFSGLGAFISSYFIIYWGEAIPRSEAVKEYGKYIPEQWTTVIIDHGVAKPWGLGTADDHPVLYGLVCLVGFLCGAIFVYSSVLQVVRRRFGF